MTMGCVVTSDPTVFAPVAELPPEEVIFGSSPAMGAIRNKVEKAANANIPVLLQGQSGTGKEILARFIHRRSRWETGLSSRSTALPFPAPCSRANSSATKEAL